MNKLSSILVFIIIAFFSCKKENTGLTEPIFAGISSSQNNNIKSYDSTRLGFEYNRETFLFLDCDNDNSNDIEVINSFISTLAGYSSYITLIAPLKSSVKIACEEMTDSIINFSIKDTADLSIKKYYDVDSVKRSYEQNFNDNVLYPQNAKLESVVTKTPSPLAFKQIIDSNLNWTTDTLTLSSSILSHSASVSGKFLNVYTTDLNYGAWKNLTNKYIGIRINDRYGWLYLEVKPNEVVILSSFIE
jgi:hypothetical protein